MAPGDGARGRGAGSGADIVVLDKTGPGAGASGIACGCVRNLYMTEPIHAILRHSVDVWTYDPVAFGFQQVGYVSAGEANQAADYEKLHASQARVGYPSDLYQGRDAKSFLKKIWPDFKTDGIDVVLHEKVSGYAGTRQAIAGLAQKCRDHGVRHLSGVEVARLRQRPAGRVSKVRTTRRHRLRRRGARPGRVDAEALGDARQALQIDARYPDGTTLRKDMWTYWRLLEGEVYVDRPYRTAGDLDPPVLHVELMNTPVVDPAHRPRARRSPLRLLEERRRADGPARRAGRHDPDQDRTEGGHRSLRPRQRRIPGRSRSSPTT